ncbi:MAG: winged helix-turn-helix transcriptional regulator [Hyphomicrobiales bacterium]|nr:winged helix-turn-helix transcriptional regulator [Hyphomicrobiales bacterium]
MTRGSITFQLAAISEDANRLGDKIFVKRFGMYVHEVRVLRLVGDQPGVTFTLLAQQTRFERSATSRILSRLIKGGYVKRVNDREDARQFGLFITAKGQKLRERADPLTADVEALLLSVLDQQERRRFMAAIAVLADWLHGDFKSRLAARYPEVEAPKKARKKSEIEK